VISRVDSKGFDDLTDSLSLALIAKRAQPCTP